MSVPRRRRHLRRLTARSLPMVMMATFFTTGMVPMPELPPEMEGRTTPLAAEEVGPGWAKRLDAGLEAEVIGFDWAGRSSGEVEIRVEEEGGWSEWMHVEGRPDEGPDPDSPEQNGRTAAGPIWVGRDIRDVEVRVGEGRLRDLKMHAISSESPKGPKTRSASASVSQPGIISRQQWGADESLRTVGPGCTGNPEYATNVRNAIVHHTASSNTYARSDAGDAVRAIYQFHTKTNGWCDIGYNFIVDRYGQVFEGRAGGIERAVIGAHAGGFNSGSTGVAVLGSFQDGAVPAEAYSSVRDLLSWKLALHNVPADGTVTVTSAGSSRYAAGTLVTLPAISGHRDVSATACPGDFTYRELARLRSDVRSSQTLGSPMLDVFAKGTNDALIHKAYDDGRWQDWRSPDSKKLTSDPTSVSWGPGRIDVFARGSDDALWHKAFDNNRWYPWTSLGGVLTSAPDVSSWGPGRLDVFVKGTDDGLHHIAFDQGRWHEWDRLGGIMTSDPAAVSWGFGRIDVFVRGTNNGLHHKAYEGGWHPWGQLGGALTSGPDVSSWGPGRLDVFFRGSDEGLHHKAYDSRRWFGIAGLGGVLTSDPGVVSSRPGRIDVFVRGTDNGLHHKAFEGHWQAWSQLGGALRSGPDASS